MYGVKVLFLVLGISCTALGQAGTQVFDGKSSNHELKLNAFNAIVLQAIDINYEYLINENSAIGLGTFHKYAVRDIEKEYWFTFEVVDNRKFAITPYFRRYFSKGQTNGFFIEGFTMVHSGRDAYFEYPYDPEMEPNATVKTVVTYKSYTRFALGLSLGGKIILKKGFLIEFYTGAGANPFNEWYDMVTRGGFSVGYRF